MDPRGTSLVVPCQVSRVYVNASIVVNNRRYLKRVQNLATRNEPSRRCRYRSRVCGPRTTWKLSVLHFSTARRANVNARALFAVLEKSERDLTRENVEDAPPIRVAVGNVISKDTVLDCLEEVLEKHLDSARVRDKANRLPLHFALDSQANFSFVKALIDVHTRSVVEPYLTFGANSMVQRPWVLGLELV